MNKIFKSLLPLLLALSLCLTGCGEVANTAKETAETPVPEFTYASKTRNAVKSTKDNAIAAEPKVITETGYYALGARFFEGTAPEGATAEFEGQFDVNVPCLSFVMNDGTVSELTAYSPVAVDTGMEEMRDYRTSNSIEAFCLRSDGNIMLVENVYTSWCEADSEVKYGSEEYYEKLISESEWWLRVLNPDGSEISRAKLDITEDEGVNFYQSICDEKGNLLSSQDTALVAFNDKGEKAYIIEIDGYVYSLATLRDGRTAALLYDIGERTMALRIVDAENGSFDETSYKLGLDAYDMFSGGGEYDLYFNSGSSCYGYDLESSTSSKLFSWINCDLISDRLYGITALADGTILAFSTDYNSKSEENATELIEVEKQPYDPSTAKKTLTLATLYSDDNMQDAVIKFNRSHEDIRINIIDYSEYNTDEDYSAGYTKLMTEIGAGTMPDLLDMSVDLPYYRFASHGLLLDLYPYIDADEELKREDFFENILGALEVNGGLYTAMPGFLLYTAVGSSKVVGDEPGLTYEEYAEALATMPEGCEGFDVGYSNSQMLSMCTALEMKDLLDWETGKCNFDSEEFLKILNFANTFPKPLDENYESSPEDSYTVRIAEGQQMLTATVLTSVDYMMEDYDAVFGGSATMIGLPTETGVGNMVYAASSMSITSNCSDKDAAWEFVRSFFTEDYQENVYYLPTNRNVFERKLADAMKVEYETDANGNYKLDENGERIKVSYGYYYDGTRQVDVYALTQRQADMLRDAVNNTTRLLNFDEKIDVIVTEGAQAFFEGQKSAEECAKLIQSKINIYVNEQK